MGNCLGHAATTQETLSADAPTDKQPTHQQLANETHCEWTKVCVLACELIHLHVAFLAVSVDEVYALEELFNSLSNSIHKVVYSHALAQFMMLTAL